MRTVLRLAGVFVIVTAAASCRDQSPEDRFAGEWVSVDSLADVGGSWLPAGSGTLALQADHQFTLKLPGTHPGEPAVTTGDWDLVGDRPTLELQATKGWLGFLVDGRLVLSDNSGRSYRYSR